MSIQSLDTMRRGLTPVYSRGMESLALTFGATAGGVTAIQPYDFQKYQDRYGRLPDSPRYLLIPRTGHAMTRQVKVWFKRTPALPEESVLVDLPSEQAGREHVIGISGPAASVTSDLRLTRFQPVPLAPPGPASDGWTVIGLLGNLAKLLWVAGWEHEEIQAQLADVAAQRNAALAHGKSLDLLGYDLGVPRFPPTAYTWDSDTLALYHVDDLPPSGLPEVVTVVDDRSRYDTITSHNGNNNGGHSGRSGRFKSAFEFRESPTSIDIPSHADFALPGNASLTVEAFIRPSRLATQTGAVIAKKAVLTSTGSAGWAIAIGSFRGFDHNVRFSASDGANQRDLYADSDLADGTYHHIAAVIERLPGPLTVLRLHIDGVQVQRVEMVNLGDLSNPALIQIGLGQEAAAPPSAQYVGLIDEIRISKTVRTSFNPVLGESDDQYRRRLRVFQRWLLPTPDGLQSAINEVAGPINGDPAPFVLVETTDPMVMGTVGLRVLPKTLHPGQCISADGNMRATEATACGLVEDETDFDEAWLRRHEDMAGLDFGGQASNRRMQWSVKLALDNLVQRCGGGAAGTGTLSVVRAYDPTATDLHRVGRALLLGHDKLPSAELAVRAHAAGFAFVCHTGTGQVHVSQARQDVFQITPFEMGSPQTPDFLEGWDLPIGIDPAITGIPGAELKWTVSRCGAGDAALITGPPGTQTKLHAIAAGDVSVHAEVTRRGHIRGGSRNVRVGLGLAGLQPGETISSAGQRNVSLEAAIGMPDPNFQAAYLVSRFDDLVGIHNNVIYGTDPNNRLMQRAVSRALDRLLNLLALSGGTLTVLNAYDPAGSALVAQGRVLSLQHSAAFATWLPAAAFYVGFDYIKSISGAPTPTIEVGVVSTELIEVTQSPQAFNAPPHEVRVGDSISLWVHPQAQTSGICFSADGSRVYVTDSGNDRVTSFLVSASAVGAFPSLSLDKSTLVAKTPIAICAAAAHVYVACGTSNTITVLDSGTLQQVGTPFATGNGPNAIATDGNLLFVSCASDTPPTIRTYDMNGVVKGQAILPFYAVSIAVSPVASATSFYLITWHNEFHRVNKATLALGPAVPTGRTPLGSAITPDGKKLYVASAWDDLPNHRGAVHVYDTTMANDPEIKTVSGFPRYSHPNMLAISADQKFVYATTLPEAPGPLIGQVHIIDSNADALMGQVFTPGVPSFAIATSPAGAPYQPCIVATSADVSTVTLGDPAPLTAAPPRSPRTVVTIPIGSGIGDQLAWSATPFSRGQVRLASNVRPQNSAFGLETGKVLVRVIYVYGHGLRPYQVKVELNSALAANPAVTVGKDQYDLVMNLLNFFHPIGVEVMTGDLRARVVELRDPSADLLPAYTFPVYRQTGLVSFTQNGGGTK